MPLPHDIRHFVSFQLANATPPQLPSYLANYVQFTPGLDHFDIRGDVSGAPTTQILDCLIEQGIQLRSPAWGFSLQGDPDRACAYVLKLSSSGDRRDMRLLNSAEDLQQPSAPRSQAKLRTQRDAILSKKPQGPFSLVANNLLVSAGALKTLGLISSAAVLVDNQPVGWHVVQPDVCSVLDASLSFSPGDDRPYRSHIASIAKPNAPLTFGLAADAERWGEKLSTEIYLIDIESVAAVFPEGRRVLGDVTLTPVFPSDSPEAELVRSVSERANQLASAHDIK